MKNTWQQHYSSAFQNIVFYCPACGIETMHPTPYCPMCGECLQPETKKMRRIIDRGELFNRLATAQDKAEIFQIINDMPAADAVDVIHCEDCMHWKYEDGAHYCLINSMILPNGEWAVWLGDEYCSRGERKQDGES